MRYRSLRISAQLLLLVSTCLSIARSESLPVCSPEKRDILVRTTLASAGFFANLRGAAHSINSRMDMLLTEARGTARELMAREQGCRHSCGNPILAVVFNSIPNKELKGYDEFPICEKFLNETSRNPIRYENRRFASDNEAKEWYHDLTQGDGTDGEEGDGDAR